MEILYSGFGPIWKSFWSYKENLFFKYVIRKILKIQYENVPFFVRKL